jgi:hypothetical protein
MPDNIRHVIIPHLSYGRMILSLATFIGAGEL